MSRFLDGISVRIKESVDAHTITKQLDHKAFERIRNFGQALVHEDAGVVIEFFDSHNMHFTPLANNLKTYHKASNIYSLKTRKTAFVFTYDVAYALSKAYPKEPFRDLEDELIYSWPLRVFCKEENVIKQIHKLKHQQGILPKSVSLEADGILLNKTHAGLFSSMNVYNQQQIRNFHNDCMGFYFFQKFTADQGKVYDLWRKIFSKQVMLYMGFRCPLNTSQIDYCRSLNIRALTWEKDRLVLL